MKNNLRCKICGSVLIGAIVIMHTTVCEYYHKRMQKEYHIIELWPSAIELAVHEISVISTSGSTYNVGYNNLFN